MARREGAPARFPVIVTLSEEPAPAELEQLREAGLRATSALGSSYVLSGSCTLEDLERLAMLPGIALVEHASEATSG
jgi:hypothetical protein